MAAGYRRGTLTQPRAAMRRPQNKCKTGFGRRAKIASRLAFGQLLLMRIYQLLMKRRVPLFFGLHGEEPQMASFCAVQIATTLALLRLVHP